MNDNYKDDNYNYVSGATGKRKKIDIMGPISIAADARNISIRDRTVIAASVINTLGVDIRDTNINRQTAWRKRSVCSY